MNLKVYKMILKKLKASHDDLTMSLKVSQSKRLYFGDFRKGK